MKQPSKYLPIWNLLKQDKTCRITAPINQHRKIIKMVRRTRDKDTAYLYDLAESHKEHEIKAASNNTIITFTLIERITLHGL